MTKHVLLLAFSFFFACTAQRQAPLPVRIAIDQERVSDRSEFTTQGDQEDYWARKLFQERYRYQKHPRFKGTIRAITSKIGPAFCYNSDTLQLLDVDNRFISLFHNGIIYPTVANFQLHRISSVEEIGNSTNSPQRKRFTFMVYDGFMFNPTKYVFELTNTQAVDITDLPTFLSDATLTYIEKGWIML